MKGKGQIPGILEEGTYEISEWVEIQFDLIKVFQITMEET